MMLKQNTTSGPVGTDVTVGNSGGASGDAFTAITLGTNGILTYDIKEGVPCLKANVVDFWQSQARVAWNLGTPGITRVAGRIQAYVHSPGSPYASGGRSIEYIELQPLDFTLRTQSEHPDPALGLPVVRYPNGLAGWGPGGQIFDDGLIPLDQWFRIEFDVNGNGPFEYDVHLFNDLTTTTPLQTWSGWQTIPGYLATPLHASTATFGPSTGAPPIWWYGNIQVNDAGMPGPGPQPAVAPVMSTLRDDFPNINTDKWAITGAVTSHAGAAAFGDVADVVATGALTSQEGYYFDLAQVRVDASLMGFALSVEDYPDYLKIVIDADTRVIRPGWSTTAGTVDGAGIPYDTVAHRYLRIVRMAGAAAFQVSPNGYDWTDIEVVTCPVGDSEFVASYARLAGHFWATVDKFNMVVPAPGDPPTEGDPPLEMDDPPEYPPDTSTPESGGEDATDPTCSTLLDRIREFSAAIKRPVRITGPNTIEVVDIFEPLPAGWNLSDANDLYSTTSHELVATEDVLAADGGLLGINVAAQLVTNDMRLVLSSWRIPDRLPVYGMTGAPVKRVTYTFTPATFSGTLEFHMRPVPLHIRKR